MTEEQQQNSSAVNSEEFNSESKKSKMDIAYYPVLQDHYLSSNMEIDKQILSLSVLAIGLMMTLGAGIEKGENLFFCMWLFSNILFLSTIVTILIIFMKNPKHISKILDEIEYGSSPELEFEISKIIKKQKRKDLFARGCFIFAIILAFLFSMLSGNEFITYKNIQDFWNI